MRSNEVAWRARKPVSAASRRPRPLVLRGRAGTSAGPCDPRRSHGAAPARPSAPSRRPQPRRSPRNRTSGRHVGHTSQHSRTSFLHIRDARVWDARGAACAAHHRNPRMRTPIRAPSVVRPCPQARRARCPICTPRPPRTGRRRGSRVVRPMIRLRRRSRPWLGAVCRRAVARSSRAQSARWIVVIDGSQFFVRDVEYVIADRRPGAGLVLGVAKLITAVGVFRGVGGGPLGRCRLCRRTSLFQFRRCWCSRCGRSLVLLRRRRDHHLRLADLRRPRPPQPRRPPIDDQANARARRRPRSRRAARRAGVGRRSSDVRTGRRAGRGGRPRTRPPSRRRTVAPAATACVNMASASVDASRAITTGAPPIVGAGRARRARGTRRPGA